MIYNLDKKLICLLLCWLVCLCVLAGCRSPEEYKVEADKQVYNIIDKKWSKDFGSKVNYKISDTEPAPNALKVEKAVPASGILTLPQAVALATAHNRQYQTEKELLYTMALDLRLSRHDFERQFFGHGFGGYNKNDDDEAVGGQGSAGFMQLLADGALISTNVTLAWVEILTGDLRSGLAALSAMGQIMPDFSEVEVLETALARRLDLANSRDAVDDAERKVVVAADGFGADLNLVGGISDPSKRRTDLISLKELEREAFVGLEGSLPLDRVAEQNIYRKTLILRSQQQRFYEEAVDLVKLEVRGAWRDLNEAAERHQIQLDNLELAKKRFENTMLLLQYGRANTRDVLDAQEDLFDAQNAATVAVVDYTIATLNFYRDTGVLAVRPDGMWQR